MEEWGDLDARLERKKRIKLRRQQREVKKQQLEMEALEKERRKLVLRCEEMEHEDKLSFAMMRFYRHQERQKRRDIQRERDMKIYEETAAVRLRAKQLSLPLETPGFIGEARLNEIKKRVETRETALQAAAQAKLRLDALPKQRSRVRSLLASYCSSTARRKVERALSKLHVEALVELLDPKIPGGNSLTTSSLLDHESPVNGFTPVLCAIFQRKPSALRRLLELKASPNVETISTGLTPLLACILTDDMVALHILVEFHVDLVYETQSGVKPLLLAADKGRNTVLKALLRLGVAVDDPNIAQARTPLMQAVVTGQYETVKILLAFGADREKRDKEGLTALDLARRWKSGHIAALLMASISSESLMAQIHEHEERQADASNRVAQELVLIHSRPPGTIAMERALRDRDVDRILELLSVDDVGYGPNYETSAGEMPLLVVSERGSAEDVLVCLERRCYVLQSNRTGANALMKAAYRADSKVMDVLIQAGCSLQSLDFQGRDTFRHLNDHNHPDIVDALTKRFASRRSSRLMLSEPLDSVSTLRAALATTAQTSNSTPHFQTSREETPPKLESDEDEDDDEEVGVTTTISQGEEMSDLDTRDDSERLKRRHWSIRRRVLHADPKRNASFEAERLKVWKYAQRGRRHGLIAPMPHDAAGRFRFPPCENCHASRARKRCFLCEQVLCDKCHARLHELPHRRHHEYEELDPTMMVGAKPKATLVINQHESLQGSVQRSLSCIETIKQVLIDVPSAPVTRPQDDLEIEKFERKQRAHREKEIAQVQINVPVAAAKYASRTGDGEIYSNPTEIELADLYLSQGKVIKARTLMETTRRVIEESLGYAHPTMLKINVRLARIQLQSGDLEQSLVTIQSALGTFESSLSPDHKDLISAQDLALHVLDTLMRYDSAVELCTRIVRLRIIGLSSTHTLVYQAHQRLELSVAKREQIAMSKEDALVLEHAAKSDERTAFLRQERERRLHNFRTLVLESTPPETFDAFLAFARKEFAEDMVHFWIAIENAKTTTTGDGNDYDAKAFRAAVVSIFLTYIKSRRIKSITAVQRKKMKKIITTPGKKVARSIFDDVQATVWDVLYNRVYPRFETTLVES